MGNFFADYDKSGIRKPQFEDILIIDCPGCGHRTYYDGGFTDCCKCCGWYNIADHSDDAYTYYDYIDGIA